MHALQFLVLAPVFLVAAGEKLRSPRALRAALVVLLGPRWRVASFRLVLAGEVALGLWLASGWQARVAAWAAAATLLALIGAAVLLHARGAGCGCFGGVGTLRAAVVRNLTLGALAVVLALGPAGSVGVGMGAAAVGVGAAAAIALAVLVVSGWWRSTVESARERPGGAAGGLLAGPQTRRGFLTRTALGVGALTAAAAARGADHAPLARAPAGCTVGRVDINVCYSPYRVVRSEPAHRLPPGYRGVALRKGPSPDAPIIYKFGEPVIIKVGRYFGRQSKRDGGVSRNCPDPGPRPSVNGFMLGYPAPPSRDKTGYLPIAYGGDTYSVPDPHCPQILCGPASLDFDCRGGADDSSPYRRTCGHRIKTGGPRGGYECGGGTEDPGTCFAPRETTVVEYPQRVKSYGHLDDLSREYYNFKYTEDGTTTHWLVPGDRVREYCIKCVRENPDPTCPPNTYDRHAQDCCQSYSCVEAIDAKWIPKGTRGWVGSAVLADGGVPPSLRRSLARVVRDVLFLGGG